MGASLREARILLRRSLPDVARDLRIRHVYLLAIEEGRLEDLPGLAYQTGFLRAYGNYLGLDGAGLAEDLKAARDATGEQDRLQVFAPIDEGHLPTRSILLLATLLAVAVYGVWYFVANTEGDPVERVAALPDRLASLLDREPVADAESYSTGAAGDAAPPDPAPRPEPPPPGPKARDEKDETGEKTGETATDAPGGAALPAEPRDEPPPAQPIDDTSAGGPSNAPPPPAEDSPPESPPPSEGNQVDPPGEIETTALPARSRPVPDDRGPTQENPPAEAEEPDPIPRVLLRAVNDSWIEIRSDDTSLVYSGLLREGESYAVPERRGLTMVTGNAGGLDVMVDGEAIPRLGPPGAVKRNISLDPDNLRGQADP